MRELDRLVHRRLDPVQTQVVGHLFGVVDDVVERRGEREDVLAIDRRDERLVEAVDDVVDDPVALVLEVEDLRCQVLAFRVVGQELVEQLRGLEDVPAGLLEQFEADPDTGCEDLPEARNPPGSYGVPSSAVRNCRSSSSSIEYVCSGAGNAPPRTSAAYSATPATICALISA